MPHVVNVITVPVDVRTYLRKNLDKLGLCHLEIPFSKDEPSVFYIQDNPLDNENKERSRRYFAVTQSDKVIVVTLYHPDPSADFQWIMPFINSFVVEAENRSVSIESIEVKFRYSRVPWGKE